MSDIELLKQTRPDVAEFVERWRKRYAGNYNFEETRQAEFYEGVVEIARHIAHAAMSASVDIDVSIEGVSSVRITAVPKICTTIPCDD